VTTHSSIASCMNFRAATEPRVSQKHSDSGLILICCRHDIPLRLFNVRGTGERLEYAQLLLTSVLSDPDCPKKLVYALLPATNTDRSVSSTISHVVSRAI